MSSAYACRRRSLGKWHCAFNLIWIARSEGERSVKKCANCNEAMIWNNNEKPVIKHYKVSMIQQHSRHERTGKVLTLRWIWRIKFKFPPSIHLNSFPPLSNRRPHHVADSQSVQTTLSPYQTNESDVHNEICLIFVASVYSSPELHIINQIKLRLF